ncbi:UDP-N-acetylmuramate dehydrogenase [Fervidobacterium changbaicum]|uniref:UDP-N-acetylenolpyruvoylglucosamine reductase n=2 Tax=Fervidobacterium TaxID=2422 RepID=A0AAI8CNR8_FERIS|nr:MULTISPECIES: UDP-N-acetylmuramate dehydrogenase [Fervidobacterium]AMW33693.2 UDP-N-acetylmuramate dehydrogenase [Fervidobacterium islandicum]QAV32662.1 UDP-N-acetylmuramate dehydrogenase [Fervidobacterium changbaicum]SDH43172.1 UDP-N-acetylmuramate dehydrogenase [Fervidobacterium changbaicum]
MRKGDEKQIRGFKKRMIEKLWDLGCDLFFNENLSHHVSFRLGGIVPLFVIPNSTEGFLGAIKLLKECEIPFRVVGKGTNIIPTDDEKDFAVISTERIDFVEVRDEFVNVSAGMSFKSLCLFALEHSLSGLENAFGLPGSVGGAIYMNAGCYGWEMAQNVVSIQAFDGSRVVTINSSEARFGYRDSIFKHERSLIIISAVLKLSKGDREKIHNLMLDTMKKRYEKQPLEYPSAGSVFKRPRPDFYVGTAIESLGLKGYQIGGAQVSEKHAGFIINKGNATASDVLKLIEFIKGKVKEHYGVDLETEVEIW